MTPAEWLIEQFDAGALGPREIYDVIADEWYEPNMIRPLIQLIPDDIDHSEPMCNVCGWVGDDPEPPWSLMGLYMATWHTERRQIPFLPGLPPV